MTELNGALQCNEVGNGTCARTIRVDPVYHLQLRRVCEAKSQRMKLAKLLKHRKMEMQKMVRHRQMVKLLKLLSNGKRSVLHQLCTSSALADCVCTDRSALLWLIGKITSMDLAHRKTRTKRHSMRMRPAISYLSLKLASM